MRDGVETGKHTGIRKISRDTGQSQAQAGLPLVREKSGKFKVREKSGNSVLGQGILEF